MIHWCCSIVDSAAARSTPARGARRFRQSPTFSNRSMSSICPDRIFDRALSKSNHSARSSSGEDWRRPLLGGHSILKVLLDSDAVSKSASPQKAHALAAALTDLSQGLQRGDRGRRTELFGKLAAGCLLRILRCAKFALWDRPSAVVLVAPEGTTGVDQQDLEAAFSATIGQYARAHVRSCGRSLRRAHVFSFCCSLEPRRIARPMFKRRNGRSRRRPGCLGRSLPLRPGSLLRGIGRKCG